MGSAVAPKVVKKINEALDNFKLSKNYLLMLGSDGPNVNKTVHRLINDDLKVTSNRSLIDIGKCNIHSVHNAFLKGLSEFGEDAVDLITAIHYFFDGWPSRWEAFTDIQNELNVPNHKFIKHCPSRWLTVGPACSRLVEQWPAVINYFLKYVPSKNLSGIEKSRTYKTVYNLLRKRNIKAELHFVISSAELFTKFTGSFQKDEPLIHVLHSELSSLLLTLMNRFCKKSYVQKNTFDLENISNEINHVPLKDMVCCDLSLKELKPFSDCDTQNFLKAAKKHYLAACKYLIEKTSLSTNLLKKLKCFHPNERTTKQSCKDIISVTKALQIDVPLDQLQDEWKAMQFEKCEDVQNQRIDQYWQKLLDQNSNGKYKYPLISKVVKAALVLSHGNADVERGFSESARALTEDKASMSERTLNSLMLIKSFLRRYDNRAELVPITKELISYAHSAHKHYESYLNEQKRLKELEEKKKKQEEEDKRIEEEKRKSIVTERKTIKECEEALKEKREKEEMKRKVSDSLFKEARKRLKQGIESKNLEEIYLAETMLKSVEIAKEEEEEERMKSNEMQKALEKRKTSLIDNYFLKMPKK